MTQNEDIWQAIRALRAAPPGLASGDAERRAVFTSSLAQAQELSNASAVAGYATRPLLLFYCLGQGLRAICAAMIEDDAWRVHGHGASVLTSSSAILATTVTPRSSIRPGRSRDALSAIQTLQTCAPLVAPMTLSAVWNAVPQAPRLPEGASGDPHPVRVHLCPHKQHQEALVQAGLVHLAIEGFDAEQGWDDLHAALVSYPSLASGSPIEVADLEPALAVAYSTDSAVPVFTSKYRIVDMSHYHPWLPHSPVLGWRVGANDPDAYMAKYAEIAPTGVADKEVVRLAFPAVGGSDRPDFLALGWVWMLSLSSLVRYEPASWVSAIDVDRSPLAVVLERVCDYATTFIPATIHHFLTGEHE